MTDHLNDLIPLPATFMVLNDNDIDNGGNNSVIAQTYIIPVDDPLFHLPSVVLVDTKASNQDIDITGAYSSGNPALPDPDVLAVTNLSRVLNRGMLIIVEIAKQYSNLEDNAEALAHAFVKHSPGTFATVEFMKYLFAVTSTQLRKLKGNSDLNELSTLFLDYDQNDDVVRRVTVERDGDDGENENKDQGTTVVKKRKRSVDDLPNVPEVHGSYLNTLANKINQLVEIYRIQSCQSRQDLVKILPAPIIQNRRLSGVVMSKFRRPIIRVYQQKLMELKEREAPNSSDGDDVIGEESPLWDEPANEPPTMLATTSEERKILDLPISPYAVGFERCTDSKLRMKQCYSLEEAFLLPANNKKTYPICDSVDDQSSSSSPPPRMFNLVRDTFHNIFDIITMKGHTCLAVKQTFTFPTSEYHIHLFGELLLGQSRSSYEGDTRMLFTLHKYAHLMLDPSLKHLCKSNDEIQALNMLGFESCVEILLRGGKDIKRKRACPVLSFVKNDKDQTVIYRGSCAYIRNTSDFENIEFEVHRFATLTANTDTVVEKEEEFVDVEDCSKEEVDVLKSIKQLANEDAAKRTKDKQVEAGKRKRQAEIAVQTQRKKLLERLLTPVNVIDDLIQRLRQDIVDLTALFPDQEKNTKEDGGLHQLLNTSIQTLNQCKKDTLKQIVQKSGLLIKENVHINPQAIKTVLSSSPPSSFSSQVLPPLPNPTILARVVPLKHFSPVHFEVRSTVTTEAIKDTITKFGHVFNNFVCLFTFRTSKPVKEQFEAQAEFYWKEMLHNELCTFHIIPFCMALVKCLVIPFVPNASTATYTDTAFQKSRLSHFHAHFWEAIIIQTKARLHGKRDFDARHCTYKNFKEALENKNRFCYDVFFSSKANGREEDEGDTFPSPVQISNSKPAVSFFETAVLSAATVVMSPSTQSNANLLMSISKMPSKPVVDVSKHALNDYQMEDYAGSIRPSDLLSNEFLKALNNTFETILKRYLDNPQNHDSFTLCAAVDCTKIRSSCTFVCEVCNVSRLCDGCHTNKSKCQTCNYQEESSVKTTDSSPWWWWIHGSENGFQELGHEDSHVCWTKVVEKIQADKLYPRLNEGTPKNWDLLTFSEKKKLSDVKEANTLIYDSPKCSFRMSDLFRLVDCQSWITSAVTDRMLDIANESYTQFYIEMCQKDVLQEHLHVPPKILFVSYSSLQGCLNVLGHNHEANTFDKGFDYGKFLRLGKALKFLQYDRLVFIMNQHNSHYYVTTVELPTNLITHRESLYEPMGPHQFRFSKCLALGIEMLRRELHTSVPSPKPWEIVYSPNTTPQINDTINCGIIAIMYVLGILGGTENKYQIPFKILQNNLLSVRKTIMKILNDGILPRHGFCMTKNTDLESSCFGFLKVYSNRKCSYANDSTTCTDRIHVCHNATLSNKCLGIYRLKENDDEEMNPYLCENCDNERGKAPYKRFCSYCVAAQVQTSNLKKGEIVMVEDIVSGTIGKVINESTQVLTNVLTEESIPNAVTIQSKVDGAIMLMSSAYLRVFAPAMNSIEDHSDFSKAIITQDDNGSVYPIHYLLRRSNTNSRSKEVVDLIDSPHAGGSDFASVAANPAKEKPLENIIGKRYINKAFLRAGDCDPDCLPPRTTKVKHSISLQDVDIQQGILTEMQIVGKSLSEAKQAKGLFPLIGILNEDDSNTSWFNAIFQVLVWLDGIVAKAWQRLESANVKTIEYYTWEYTSTGRQDKNRICFIKPFLSSSPHDESDHPGKVYYNEDMIEKDDLACDLCKMICLARYHEKQLTSNITGEKTNWCFDFFDWIYAYEKFSATRINSNWQPGQQPFRCVSEEWKTLLHHLCPEILGELFFIYPGLVGTCDEINGCQQSISNIFTETDQCQPYVALFPLEESNTSEPSMQDLVNFLDHATLTTTCPQCSIKASVKEKYTMSNKYIAFRMPFANASSRQEGENEEDFELRLQTSKRVFSVHDELTFFGSQLKLVALIEHRSNHYANRLFSENPTIQVYCNDMSTKFLLLQQNSQTHQILAELAIYQKVDKPKTKVKTKQDQKSSTSSNNQEETNKREREEDQKEVISSKSSKQNLKTPPSKKQKLESNTTSAATVLEKMYSNLVNIFPRVAQTSLARNEIQSMIIAMVSRHLSTFIPIEATFGGVSSRFPDAVAVISLYDLQNESDVSWLKFRLQLKKTNKNLIEQQYYITFSTSTGTAWNWAASGNTNTETDYAQVSNENKDWVNMGLLILFDVALNVLSGGYHVFHDKEAKKLVTCSEGIFLTAEIELTFETPTKSENDHVRFERAIKDILYGSMSKAIQTNTPRYYMTMLHTLILPDVSTGKIKKFFKGNLDKGNKNVSYSWRDVSDGYKRL